MFCNKRLLRIHWLHAIIFALSFSRVFVSSLVLTDAPAEDSNRDHNESTKAALVPRYHVVTTEEYAGDILRTGLIYNYPSVFYTSFPRDGPITEQGLWKARDWARDYFGRGRFVTYDTASDTFVSIMSPCDVPTDAQDILRVQHMSKAFALTAYETAYLVMPENAPIHPESYWAVFEWPLLTRNVFVERIIQVELPSGRQGLFWSRADGPKGTVPPPDKRKREVRSLQQSEGIVEHNSVYVRMNITA
ncbi:MAG: hypothetical protein Q9220_003888 [cf. Caloplaca sp. 1 TL-2023]